MWLDLQKDSLDCVGQSCGLAFLCKLRSIYNIHRHHLSVGYNLKEMNKGKNHCFRPYMIVKAQLIASTPMGVRLC